MIWFWFLKCFVPNGYIIRPAIDASVPSHPKSSLKLAFHLYRGAAALVHQGAQGTTKRKPLKTDDMFVLCMYVQHSVYVKLYNIYVSWYINTLSYLFVTVLLNICIYIWNTDIMFVTFGSKVVLELSVPVLGAMQVHLHHGLCSLLWLSPWQHTCIKPWASKASTWEHGVSAGDDRSG